MPCKDYMILHLDDIDYNAERVAKGYSVGGTIYLQIGGAYFPAEQWYDIVSTDLSNWLPQLISFSLNHTNSCVLSFMDGPYQVKLQRYPAGNVIVVCTEDQKIVIPQTEIDFSGFITSIVKCVRRYNRILHEKGGVTQFTKELTKLKEITTSYTY